MNVDAALDPVTLEVIRSALKAHLDEVELTLCRTAHSSTIYEVRDMCAGWVDPECKLIAQGRYGLPIFIGDIGLSISRGLEIRGLDGFRPGDAILTNHAGSCGQHLNNVVVYAPVFSGGKPVAFTVTRAHWADVGGSAVGSGNESTEIFQEGVQWDNLLVARDGELVQDTSRMIEANVRFPKLAMGDLRAQIAACRLGERRLMELIDKFSLDQLHAAIDRIWAQSEERARLVVSEIPDGTYTASSFLDDDGLGTTRLNLEVAVTVSGSNMTVDLTGTHPQTRGPVNCGVSGAIAAARVAFKCVTAPAVVADEGAFAPLSVIVPEGTLVSALPPAPLAQWSTALPTLVETVLLALAPVLPERIPAAHCGATGTCRIIRRPSATETGFVHADPLPGGWGARPHSDGPVPLKTYQHGDTFKIPAELEELRYPFRIVEYSLREDSGGAGAWRGGLGLDRTFEFIEDLCVTVSLERSTCPPWGLAGGASAVGPIATLVLSDGTTETFRKATMKPVPAGSRLTISTAGGGGFGPPEERDVESVRRDVQAGYVSLANAHDAYKVELRVENGEVFADIEATRTLRAS